jgi:hypothetical protein
VRIAEKRAANKAAHLARDHNAETDASPDEPDTDEIPVVPSETVRP